MPHDLTPRLVRGVFLPEENPPDTTKIKHVGGGLPPITVCQSIPLLLIHRHRGQAPSHIEEWANQKNLCETLIQSGIWFR